MALKVSNTCPDLSSKYKSVLDAVTLAHQEPYAIEILLESHSLPEGIFTIIDDASHSIGIPRRVLKDAAQSAWHGFFHVDAALEARCIASSIILLLHPEHVTATNARKRFVIDAHEKDERDHRITRDLCFLKSLFMSPLHRHTKSPTLWAHREWLIKQLDIYAQRQFIDMDRFGTCLRAAEIHPKNVYAWQYLRYRLSDTSLFRLALPHNNEGGVNLETEPEEDVRGMQAMISYFEGWCLKHLSDTSGWSFLLWLLTASPAAHQDSEETQKCQVAVFGEVLRRATCFGFRNEALWGFLRTMAGCSTIPAQMKADFRQSATHLLAEGRDVRKWLSILDK